MKILEGLGSEGLGVRKAAEDKSNYRKFPSSLTLNSKLLRLRFKSEF